MMLMTTPEHSFTVIVVFETWAKDNSDTFLQTAGYNCVSVIRSSQGGEVALYIRSDSFYVRRDDLCRSSTFDCLLKSIM